MKKACQRTENRERTKKKKRNSATISDKDATKPLTVRKKRKRLTKW
jgi:hypothetical protein